MTISHSGQRTVGLLSLAVGVGGAAWSWYTATAQGYYYIKAALIFPVFAILGMAAIFFPLDEHGQEGELSLARPERFLKYPTSWKVLTIVALTAGFANWFLLSQVVAE
jgi:hypothetical protein